MIMVDQWRCSDGFWHATGDDDYSHDPDRDGDWKCKDNVWHAASSDECWGHDKEDGAPLPNPAEDDS